MKSADAKSRGSSQNAGKASRAPRPFFRGGRGDFGQREHFFPRAPEVQRQPFFQKGPIQPKLSVGRPGDPFEQEADRVAERVVAGRDLAAGEGNSSPSFTGVQRKPIFESEGAPELQSKPLSSRAGAAPPIQANAVAPAADELQNDQETSDEEPLQRKPIFAGASAAPGDTIRRKGDGTPSVTPATMSTIQSPGSGAPLSSAVRSRIEPSLGGGDLSGVRVHGGRAANEAASSLGARAFTHGNNIWLGPGESSNDLRLMAHEATHVAQQGGGSPAPAVQRDPAPAAEPVDLAAKRVSIPVLNIPRVKATTVPQTGLEVSSLEARTNQLQDWKRVVKPAVQSALPDKLNNVPGIKRGAGGQAVEERADDPNKIYFLRIGGSQENIVLGNSAQLADELTIPRWGPDGVPRTMDVDHKKELQLGGAASNPDNFWLLDASKNRSSGSRIARSLRTAVATATAAHTGPGKQWESPPTVESLTRQGFTVRFERIEASLPPDDDANARWSKDDVTGLKPWDKLAPLSLTEIVQGNLLGDNTHLVVFPASGGHKKVINGWDPAQGTKPLPNGFLKGLKNGVANYQPGGGTVAGTVFGGQYLEEKPVSFPLQDVAGLPFTTSINRGEILPSMRFAEFKSLSPIEFDDAGYEETRGFYAHGILRPSLPVLRDLEIDVMVDANGITFSKTFTKDNFAIPGPIQITDASVVLSAGTSGFAAEGTVNFEISRLGKGHVTARVGTSGGFELAGKFEFDSDFFDPASIDVRYAEGRWSGSGRIGIPDGKVSGIRSANLTVSYNDGVITAGGNVRPKIPGVENANLVVRYSEAEGLVIRGTVQLSQITGIRSGSLEVTVAKTDRWKVSGTGTAVPDVPGVSTVLNITYDDGLFDVRGTAAYQRGMLSGSVEIGVTNRPVAAGQPAGEPTDTLTVYGGGTLSIRIAPWLQGTIGVRLLPNGELEVSGQIGLPGSVQIFDRKEINKSLFNIAVQAPIFPGIVAEIGGGLGAVAGIGPGMLEQLQLGITYNPSHEDQTRVTGDARLRVPADAGLRLSVRAGIGLGITGASATGGLEIGGTLGIEGAAEASVHVEWTPTKGLDLTAEVSLHAQPSFTFDLSGYVSVRALGFSVYDKTWQFASFRFGSDYRFGIRLPVHYREGQPFNISLDDVQFEVPQVSPGELLQGLINRIA
jgi:hypothetical protein